MRLHYFQHVPFEDLAHVETWAKKKKFSITRTAFHQQDPLPSVEHLDWLVIMGGPMNIYEEDKFPWLAAEKKFIEQAIKQNKVVIGVCLGAQLIADVLGAKVTQNRYKEIGWLPLTLTPEASNSAVFSVLPKRFTAFHWHGDTFDLPSGAIRIASSEGCLNQAFEYKKRVFGLQFHLESSDISIRSLMQYCGDELVLNPYIQSRTEIIANLKHVSPMQGWLENMLNQIEKL